MSEQTEHAEQSPVRPDWRGMWLLPVVALLLGMLLWHDQSKVAAARAEAARVAAEAEQAHRTIGAPTVRKGKPVNIKGKAMSSWIVSGAGVSAYDGTYAEDGTYDSAPAYTNGSKWLYKTSEGGGGVLLYSFGPTKGDANTVYVTTTALPGNPWSPAIEGVGEPAPSVSQAGGTAVDGEDDPYNLPYANWWWDGPYFGGVSPIRPALVTVDSTQYVVFLSPDEATYSFALFDTSAHTWSYLSYDNAPWAAWDTVQGGCLIDAGDGENVWCLSGGHLDGETPQFVCSKHSLLTGARVSQQAVTLEAVTITNVVDVDGGTTGRFCERSTGTLRYHTYTYGAASYTELFEAAAGAWSGLPVGWTDSTVDQLLYRTSNGDSYYLRRSDGGATPYYLTDSAAAQLPSLRGSGYTAGNGYETCGEYRSQIVYSAPTGTWNAGVWTWEPGGQFAVRPSFASYPMGRHWYLTDSANGVLYVAGWGYGGSNARPFVAAIAPATGGTPGLIASTAQVFAPTIAKHVSGLSLIASTATVYAPTIAGVDLVDAGSRIGRTATVYTPTLYGTADRTAAAGAGVWRRVRAKVGPAPV